MEIAYIDDDQLNLDYIESILQNDFKTHIYQDPHLYLTKFSQLKLSALLIDVHMPVMDGFTLYENIIQHPNYNGCPILFISYDDTERARIKSFELGAVDFLNRTIAPEELIARIKSKIMFFQKHKNIIELAGLRVNLTLLKAYFENNELPLTFIEFKILSLMLRNQSQVVSKEVLIQQVWNLDHVLDATIHTHVSNLNAKIELWSYEITAVKFKGLQLVRKNKR